MTATKTKAATEGQMVAMLRTRVEASNGNGPAGCVVAQVRDAASFDATRSIDAVSMRFWKSQSLLLEGYECKSSRGDLLRELKDPAKAEQFAGKLDRFWIVAGGPGIVKPEELPPAWGLLVVRSGALVQIVPAQPLHERRGKTLSSEPLPEGFDRGFLVGLLRNASKRAAATPDEIHAAADAARKSSDAIHCSDIERLEARLEKAEQVIRTFRDETGIDPRGMGTWPQNPKATAAAVKLVMSGKQNVAEVEAQMRRLKDDALRIGRFVDHVLPTPPKAGS